MFSFPFLPCSTNLASINAFSGLTKKRRIPPITKNANMAKIPIENHILIYYFYLFFSFLENELKSIKDTWAWIIFISIGNTSVNERANPRSTSLCEFIKRENLVLENKIDKQNKNRAHFFVYIKISISTSKPLGMMFARKERDRG